MAKGRAKKPAQQNNGTTGAREAEKGANPASGAIAPESEPVAAGWLARRVEELESALEEASERLQRSLKRQGELEAAAEAARVKAEHLEEADAQAKKLARDLDESNEQLHKLGERARSLGAERDHLNDELAELRKILSEREKNLGKLAAESGKERLALQEQINKTRTSLDEKQAALANVQGEAATLREEVSRLSDHLAEREKALAHAARESAGERERLLNDLRALQDKAEKDTAEAAEREAALREQLATARGDENAQREKVRQLETELGEERSAAEHLRSELEAERAQLESLGQTRAALENDLTEARTRSEELEASRDELSQQITEREQTLREELKAARTERERTVAKFEDDLRAERESLLAQLEEKEAALREQLREAESGREAAERRHEEELTRQREELLHQLGEKERTLREQLESAKAERESLERHHAEALSKEREQAEAALHDREQALESHLEEARAEREVLARRSEEARKAERAELLAQLEEKERTLREQFESARAEREEAEARHGDTLRTEREELSRRLDEKEHTLRQQMEAARAEREQLRADFEGRLRESAERLEQAMAARATLKQNLETLRGELTRVDEEKSDLTRILREREETLRKELDAARAERERGAGVLESTQEEYEKILREHGVLSEKAQRLEDDVEQLTGAAKRESERARNMAAEVVGLEDRIRELTLQLERAQTPRDASEEEQERIAAAIAVEREKATTELKRLREQGEELAHRLKQTEREAENLSAARAELERRADAAESLVRERLKSPAPVAEAAAASSPALDNLAESLGRSASDLVGSIDRLDQFLRRMPSTSAEEEEPGSSASDVLAQKVQAMEIVGRRLESHLARLEANPSDAAMLPPPGASDPTLSELREFSATQAREMAALRKQLATIAKRGDRKTPPAGPPAGDSRKSDSLGIYAAAAVIVLLMGALVAGGYVAYTRLASRIDEGQQLARKYLEQAGTPRPEGATAMAPLPLPRLVRPPAGSTVRGGEIDIKGEAKGADAVFLYVGNALFTVTGVKDGRFVFADVPLEPGKNLVAVRSLTDSGRTSERLETTLLRSTAVGAVPPRKAVRDFMRGPTDRKHIALTFDGDDPKGALNVLDILKRENIRTTIFLTGQFIDASPEVTRRVASDGHEVGNHLWNHPHLTTFDENSRHDTRPEMNKARFQSQLIRTASRFEEVTGKKMAALWRAPYGEVNSQLMRWAEELGYKHINWTRDYQRGVTLDSLDWVIDRESHRYFTNEEIVQKLLDFGRGDPHGTAGGIVLMHLNTRRPNGDALHERLDDLIEAWRSQGYQFVKISDMMARAEQG